MVSKVTLIMVILALVHVEKTNACADNSPACGFATTWDSDECGCVPSFPAFQDHCSDHLSRDASPELAEAKVLDVMGEYLNGDPRRLIFEPPNHLCQLIGNPISEGACGAGSSSAGLAEVKEAKETHEGKSNMVKTRYR